MLGDNMKTDLSTDSYLSVTSAHIQTKSDMNGFGPARRRNFILHYVIEGNGYYEVENSVYYITKGQSFIIYPGETVTYYPEPENPWIYAWVNFVGVEAGQLLSYIGFSKNNRVAPYIDKEIILPIFENLKNPSDRSNQAFNTKNTGYLQVLLSIYMERFPGKTECISEKLLSITDYISSNYADTKLAVDELSKKFWISRSQLYREFIKGFGMPPSRYINQFRILKAIQMFKQGERNIEVISRSVGYSDRFYFWRVFKKITGKSPKDFRNSVD